MRRRWPAALIAIGLLVSACSSNPGGSATPGVVTPSATPLASILPSPTPQPTPGADGIILLQAQVPRAPAAAADARRAADTINAFGLALFLGAAGGPPKFHDVRLDHPFLFALRDLETGTVLFLGQVADPSVASGAG